MNDLKKIISDYNPELPLERASTIPSSWYTNTDLYNLELKTVFAKSWQLAARAGQVTQPGHYVTTDIAGEPILIVRGADNVLRAFFNVCRHHAAAVMTEAEGEAAQLRCPYHGWTYSLEGELKGTPDFAGVCNFDRSATGLVPVSAAIQDKWAFIKLDSENPPLEHYLGKELITQLRSLHLENFQWFERRRYILECNWKVFV